MYQKSPHFCGLLGEPIYLNTLTHYETQSEKRFRASVIKARAANLGAGKIWVILLRPRRLRQNRVQSRSLRESLRRSKYRTGRLFPFRRCGRGPRQTLR